MTYKLIHGFTPFVGNVTKVYKPMEDPSCRIAKCEYCKLNSASDPKLPAFKEQIDKPYDLYYCGCMGWD